MKIITCASFYGSGSSAVTDLVSEYSNVNGIPEYEFRFLHDPDGVSDLEFQLVECHNRHNAGHAIKRFYRISKFNAGTWFNKRYEPYFNNQYLKLTNEYINKLKVLEYPGWWFYDLYDKVTAYYYLKQIENKICRLLFKNKIHILKNEKTICSHPTEEEFLKYTQEYTAALMQAANVNNSEYLELDQIVPSQNISRIVRYFKDDIFVIKVCRDPRDVYISSKIVWKTNIVPVYDVKDYCTWYRYIREAGSTDDAKNKSVLEVRFEDIVYKYNETVEAIEKFTGLKKENHINQFARLNPKRSVINTKQWEKYPEESDNIKYIEKELAEYLYDFDSVKDLTILGKDEKDKAPF